MRLLIYKNLFYALISFSLIAQCAYAQNPTDVQTTTSHGSSLVPQTTSFHLSESERKVIANYPSWTASQKPFRIYGNTWYVGPHGLGVYLITAPTGHVLIDGGLPGNASLIEENVRRLGFKLHDIKWILISHAHYDHAGGIAQLASDTGAQVIAGARDVALLKRGGHDDPQYGDRFPFSPIDVTSSVTDGETLHLRKLVLTAHATPGHTKGNTTWTWLSCDATRCMHMVDVGSLSAPGYDLIGNLKNPDIIEDFEHSFTNISSLPCDIPLAPHPSAVHFWDRYAARRQGDENALINPSGCRAYAKRARKQFKKQLAKQRKGDISTE